MNYAGKWLLLALACSPAVAAGNPFIGKWKETSINPSTLINSRSSLPQSALNLLVTTE